MAIKVVLRITGLEHKHMSGEGHMYAERGPRIVRERKRWSRLPSRQVTIVNAGEEKEQPSG